MQDPFVVALDTFIAKAKAKQDVLVQAIALAALTRVKELTPVDTGYLRANWTIVIGSSASSIAPSADASDREQESLTAVAQLKTGDVFTLVNPVVYARRIEEGFVGKDSLGRFYNQQGVHMLQQTIIEMPQLAANAVAKVEGLP